MLFTYVLLPLMLLLLVNMPSFPEMVRRHCR